MLPLSPAGKKPPFATPTPDAAAVDDVENLVGSACEGDALVVSAATMVEVLTMVSAASMFPLPMLMVPRRGRDQIGIGESCGLRGGCRA